MRLAIAGDDGQYRQLLSEVARTLRVSTAAHFARAGRGNLDVEDVVQETLLAIHLKRHTWNRDLAFSPWLNAIARHKLIDAFRRTGARIMIEIDDVVGDLVAPIADPDETSDIERLVTQLPDRQQAIVRAISIDGRGIKETAEKLGMQEGALRVALHRSLKRLAALYRGEA